mmetsp:Transcript_43105/g.121916  ORF Transcript_43105/g.121916 Transcript_43105/m.121916 type:complete len:185 (-) Transcript_43105:183-737(-)
MRRSQQPKGLAPVSSGLPTVSARPTSGSDRASSAGGTKRRTRGVVGHDTTAAELDLEPEYDRLSDIAFLAAKHRKPFALRATERSSSSPSDRDSGSFGSTARHERAAQLGMMQSAATNRRHFRNCMRDLTSSVEFAAEDMVHREINMNELPPVARSFNRVLPSTYSKSSQQVRLPPLSRNGPAP